MGPQKDKLVILEQQELISKARQGAWEQQSLASAEPHQWRGPRFDNTRTLGRAAGAGDFRLTGDSCANTPHAVPPTHIPNSHNTYHIYCTFTHPYYILHTLTPLHTYQPYSWTPRKTQQKEVLSFSILMRRQLLLQQCEHVQDIDMMILENIKNTIKP
jgi:hypothetical protein